MPNDRQQFSQIRSNPKFGEQRDKLINGFGFDPASERVREELKEPGLCCPKLGKHQRERDTHRVGSAQFESPEEEEEEARMGR